MEHVGSILTKTMNELDEPLRTIFKQALEDSKTMTLEQMVQRDVDRYNALKGELNGDGSYDCEICRNKGYVAVIEDGREVLRQCKCMSTRRTIWRMQASGLASTIRRYRFANFNAKEPWQKKMLDTAKAYADAGIDGGAWFYIGGAVGCVDADTEFFNGTGWQRIADYNGEKVLQYNPDTKQATLINPIRYIVKDADTLFRIKTSRGGIDQVLSKDHDFAYITSKGHMRKKRFDEVIELHKKSVNGFYGKVATTFDFNGDGIPLTDQEIRIMGAVMADGSFRNDQIQCTVRVKKERKKERMRELLDGMKYKEYHEKSGFSIFRFYAPRREKAFTDYWYGCNAHQLSVIADEVFHWDGSVSGKRASYCSTQKQSADFVQFALAASGKRSTIYVDRHREKNCYVVIKNSHKPEARLITKGGVNKATIEEYKTIDGKQYCFTVPTGYLVLRRNGRIFITGNCGKSHLCTAIVREALGKGRAALYISWPQEATKIKASITDDNEYESRIRSLKEIELLYIDDFFKPVNDMNPSGADIRLAYEILNYRYVNHKPTIISSELYLSEVEDIDEAIGSRIYEYAKGYTVLIKRDPARNQRKIVEEII